jgi:hypothetical protein
VESSGNKQWYVYPTQPGDVCTDVPPDSRYTCAQQVGARCRPWTFHLQATRHVAETLNGQAPAVTGRTPVLILDVSTNLRRSASLSLTHR